MKEILQYVVVPIITALITALITYLSTKANNKTQVELAIKDQEIKLQELNNEMLLITDKGNPRACHVYEKLGGKNDYKDEIVYVYDYEKGDK